MKSLSISKNSTRNISDLVNALNRSKQQEMKSDKVFFSEDYFRNLTTKEGNKLLRYKTFFIQKKNGKMREISAPNKELKELMHYINIYLEELYHPQKNVMGFVRGRSIVDNARMHIGKNYVFNIDLTCFFHYISQSRVSKRLTLRPFNFNEKLAKIIATLCCKKANVDGGLKYILPQGAPTSPILTNAVCDFLDKKLQHLANKYGVNYTRYADDITFSSMHNVYQEHSKFRQQLLSIIEEEKFVVNTSKTRLQKRNVRQEVTGLTVNDKINTSHHYIRELRNILYIWETYGYKDAYSRFYVHYKKTKGNVKKGEPVLENVIVGKLNFLKMVKGKNDKTYLQLLSRFESLNPSYVEKQSNSAKNDMKYILSFSVQEFENLFKTKVELLYKKSGALSAIFSIENKSSYVILSKDTKDAVLAEAHDCNTKCRFTIESLDSFYIVLSRFNNINFWMLLPNKPSQNRIVHPKYNNIPFDSLLKNWEEFGIKSAAISLANILENNIEHKILEDIMVDKDTFIKLLLKDLSKEIQK